MCCHYPSLLSWNNVFKLCFKANIFFVVNVPSKIWVGKILKSECIQNLNALFSYNIVVVNEVVQGVCECQDLHFRNCRTALPFFFRGIRFFYLLVPWGKQSCVYIFLRPCLEPWQDFVGMVTCSVQCSSNMFELGQNKTIDSRAHCVMVSLTNDLM